MWVEGGERGELRVGGVVTLDGSPVLSPLDGTRSGLEVMLERLQASKTLESIMVASPQGQGGQEGLLASILGSQVYQGRDEWDVLGRLFEASEGVDVVVHVPGNQPLVDPGVVDRMVDSFRRTSTHYTACERPDGFRCSVFRRYLLSQAQRRIVEFMKDPVSVFTAPPTRLRAGRFKVGESKYNFALRGAGDVPFLRALVERCGTVGGVKDYVRVAESDPEIGKLGHQDDVVEAAYRELE